VNTGHYRQSLKSDQPPKGLEFLRFSTARTAPSVLVTEIAGTRQIFLHEQCNDRDRIVLGPRNADPLIRRERLLDLATAVQDAEEPDALVAARGIASKILDTPPLPTR
jgi:hypothetical protein